MRIFVAPYGDCGKARSGEWVDRLERAGHDVDLGPQLPYSQIFSLLKRSDVVVAPLDYPCTAGTQWAVIIESALLGKDTRDGASGVWTPRPTFMWWSEPLPEPLWVTMFVDQGAVRLSGDFEAAVTAVLQAADTK